MRKIGKELTKCPICGHFHETDLWEEPRTVVLDGKEITFNEMSYTCPDTKNSDRFANTELIRRNLRRMNKASK